MHHASGSESDLHRRIVDRLGTFWYGTRIINNVERGFYVEGMVELALRERDLGWRLTDTWEAWDIEHEPTCARVEVKQSARVQTWCSGSSAGVRPPTFSIRPCRRWDGEASRWSDEPRQRWADVYVFAWHSESDREVADHSSPSQWEFYVVAERCLPQEPPTESISLNPLRQLVSSDLASRCSYNELAERITCTVGYLDTLKADTAKVG